MGWLDNAFLSSVTSDGFLEVTLSDAVPTTITLEQYRTGAIKLVGTITADQVVTFPFDGGNCAVKNDTTGGFSTRCKGASGNGTNIGNGQLKSTVSTASAIVGDSNVEVDSIARLTALVPAQGDVAFVRGYYTAGDGGGGQFRWNYSSSATQNYGTIFASDLGGTGRWERVFDNTAEIPARWFGVRSNGVTNDYTAWSRVVAYAITITAGATILVPQGISLLSGADLVITTTVPLTFRGTGWGCVIKGNGQENIFSIPSVGVNTGVITFDNFKIDGGAVCARAFLNRGSNKLFRMQKCEITSFNILPASSFASVFLFSSCDTVEMDYNYFHDCGQLGVKTTRFYHVVSSSATGVTNSKWKLRYNIVVNRSATVGFALFDSAECDAVGNYGDMGGARSIYDSSGGDGYFIVVYNGYSTGATPRRIRITDNWALRAAGTGLYVQTVPDSIVARNYAIECALTMVRGISLLCGGIAIAGSDRCIAPDNHIYGGMRDGLSIQSHDCITTGTIVTNTGETGILYGANNRCSLSGSKVTKTFGKSAWKRGSNVDLISIIVAGDNLAFPVDGQALSINFDVTDNTGPKIAARVQTEMNKYVGAVSSFGTVPPVITITGTGNQFVDVIIRATTAGTRTNWKFEYSTDRGQTWIHNITSSASAIPMLNTYDNSSTGLSINIAVGTATAATAFPDTNNYWTFTTLGICDVAEDEVAGVPTHLIIQSRTCGTGSTIGSFVGTPGSGGTNLLDRLGLTTPTHTQTGATSYGLLFSGVCVECNITDVEVKEASAGNFSFNNLSNSIVNGITARAAGGSQQIVLAAGSKNIFTNFHSYSSVGPGGTGIDIRGSNNLVYSGQVHDNNGIGVLDFGTTNTMFDIAATNNSGGNLSEGSATNPVRPHPCGALIPTVAVPLTVGHISKATTTTALGLGYLVNANVDAAAAIAGSKIAPDFGAQLVQTTGGFGSSGTLSLKPVGGVSRFDMTTTTMTISVPSWICYATGGSFNIYQDDDATNSATGKKLTVHAQHATGTTSTGGAADFGSGTGTSDHGAARFMSGSCVGMQVDGTGSTTKLAFYGGATITKPSVGGALSAVIDANAKAVLTSIIAALVQNTGVNLITDGTT